MTSRTVTTVRYPLAVRRLEVAEATWLGGGQQIRRLVLTGAELDGFRTDSPTDHLKLLVPAPGEADPALPSVLDDRIVPSADGRRPVARDYTVRAFDPAARRLTVDVVVHGEGPVSTWAAGAMPGQFVGVAGPRGSHVVPDGYEGYLLIGDLTALPAIARWVEELRSDQAALVLVAGVTAPPVPLTGTARIDLRCVDTDALVGTVAALAEHDLPAPAPEVYAWAAGEATTMRAVRRVLVERLGLTSEQFAIEGYWRQGRADHDHHAPLDAD